LVVVGKDQLEVKLQELFGYFRYLIRGCVGAFGVIVEREGFKG